MLCTLCKLLFSVSSLSLCLFSLQAFISPLGWEKGMSFAGMDGDIEAWVQM